MTYRRNHPHRLKTAVALGVAVALAATGCAGAGGGGSDGKATVTVATVATPQMQDIEKLSAEFEKANPDIDLKFSVLPENELRDRVTQDIATKAGQYDVVTIGTYETPIRATTSATSSPPSNRPCPTRAGSTPFRSTASPRS
jgi:sorbitol/mannitol transport system substrate-binding protein